MRGLVVVVASVAVGLGSGCANAPRYVHKAGDEGIVAIADRSDSWPSYHLTNAKKLIEAHVGPQYDILEEKEVITGNVTQHQQHVNRDTAVNPLVPFLQAEQQQVTTTSTTMPTKEWHIHYRRRQGVPVGTGFGGPGPFGGLQPANAQRPFTQSQQSSSGTHPNAGSNPVQPAGGSPSIIPSVLPAGAPPTPASPPASSVSPAAMSLAEPSSSPPSYPQQRQQSIIQGRAPTITVTGN